MGRALAVVCVAALAVPAAAQPADSVAAADQLFEQGRQLFDKGDYEAACPRFEASLKLDPALGTLLNLATCYDKAGKLASAWGHYREVVMLATKVGDTARIDIARERIKALEPRLPKLTIRLPKTTIPGLVVSRDDLPLETAVLGTAFYVDPGDHVITASAPDRVPASQHVTIAEDEAKEIQLPDLALAPHAKPPPNVTTIIREDIDPGRSRRVFGLTLGGAGIAALVTAVGFGFAARSSWNSAFDEGACQRSTYQCTAAGQDLADTARSRALVANVIGGAGLLLIGGGAVLYFTAPTHDVAVTPTAGGATLTFGGRW